jgi:hypothetical protein
LASITQTEVGDLPDLRERPFADLGRESRLCLARALAPGLSSLRTEKGHRGVAGPTATVRERAIRSIFGTRIAPIRDTSRAKA